MKSFLRPVNAFPAVLAGLLWCAGLQASPVSDQGAANVSAPNVPALAERGKLRSEHFTEVRDAAAFPAGCKSGFATLTKTPGFELANPGQPFQATDVVGPKLPWRRLLFGGVSNDRCVVFYEIGGFAPYRAVVVLDVSGKTPVLTWGGAGGKNPADMRELISQIAEGAFRSSPAY